MVKGKLILKFELLECIPPILSQSAVQTVQIVSQQETITLFQQKTNS